MKKLEWKEVQKLHSLFKRGVANGQVYLHRAHPLGENERERMRNKFKVGEEIFMENGTASSKFRSDAFRVWDDDGVKQNPEFHLAIPREDLKFMLKY